MRMTSANNRSDGHDAIATGVSLECGTLCTFKTDVGHCRYDFRRIEEKQRLKVYGFFANLATMAETTAIIEFENFCLHTCECDGCDDGAACNLPVEESEDDSEEGGLKTFPVSRLPGKHAQVAQPEVVQSDQTDAKVLMLLEELDAADGMKACAIHKKESLERDGCCILACNALLGKAQMPMVSAGCFRTCTNLKQRK
jgi:hypothetical protein